MREDRDRRRRLPERSRGVSDTLGYVLTFSVVLASVLGVATVGFDQLDEIQQSEQIANAERAFRLLERDLDQLQQSQAESRRGELDLRSGRLRFVAASSDGSAIEYHVNGTDVSGNVGLAALEYEVEETTVAYESGAVFYIDSDSNEVLEDGPELYCRHRGGEPGRAIVSTVSLENQGTVTGFGSGIVGITGTVNRTRLLFPKNRTGADSVDEATGVTVEISSAYAEAWEQYFVEETTGWEALPGEDKYRCEDADGIQVYVRHTSINVTFSR
ncbi:MAG: hypothetical protein ABEH56_03370 [Salinirussus sp.]